MRKTNLQVRLQLVTPQVAKNYLEYNKGNRKVSEKNLYFLTNQMKNDNFLENGESIVFDRDGVLKDGQHRLEAIVKSGKSYYMPIVTGVDSLTMATYDTGKRRNASDVLELSGFKSSSAIAALILAINSFHNNSKRSKMSSNIYKGGLTNQQVLDYCQDNYDWLKHVNANASNILYAMKPKVLTRSQIGLFLYIIGGKYPQEIHIDFMKNLTGIKRGNSTSTDYVFTKLYNAKKNKEPLSFHWVTAMTIKAWNYFADGNPSVKYFKFDSNNDLPKAIKYE